MGIGGLMYVVAEFKNHVSLKNSTIYINVDACVILILSILKNSVIDMREIIVIACVYKHFVYNLIHVSY